MVIALHSLKNQVSSPSFNILDVAKLVMLSTLVLKIFPAAKKKVTSNGS